MKKLILVISIIFSIVSFSDATVSLFGGLGDPGNLSFEPLFSIGNFLSVDLTTGLGVLEFFDVYANLSTLEFIPGFSFGSIWLMPRLETFKGSILALQIGLESIQGNNQIFKVSPQYHLETEVFESFSVIFNFWCDFILQNKVKGITVLGSGISPSYGFNLSEDVSLSLFVDLLASYEVVEGSKVGFEIVPGILLSFPYEIETALGLSVSPSEDSIDLTVKLLLVKSFKLF